MPQMVPDCRRQKKKGGGILNLMESSLDSSGWSPEGAGCGGCGTVRDAARTSKKGTGTDALPPPIPSQSLFFPASLTETQSLNTEAPAGALQPPVDQHREFTQPGAAVPRKQKVLTIPRAYCIIFHMRGPKAALSMNERGH